MDPTMTDSPIRRLCNHSSPNIPWCLSKTLFNDSYAATRNTVGSGDRNNDWN